MAYDQRGWGSDWPTDHVVPGMRSASLAFMAKCHVRSSAFIGDEGLKPYHYLDFTMEGLTMATYMLVCKTRML